MKTLPERLDEARIRLAPIGRRSVAYAIDDMLVSLLFVIILWEPIAAAKSTVEIAMLINSVWLYMAMVQIAYHTWFVYQYGASLGKIAMKMRVAGTADFGRPTFAMAFNRAIFRLVSGMVFYLGFVWAFFDPARQAWHDKTAQTVVVDA
jgi:uncharacterized RDD family membrane protein YckC